MSWTITPEGALQIDKDPAASLRYGFNVADVLAPGDSVSGISISAQSGITVSAAGYSGTVVSCRVAGGTAGTTGSATLRWTTAQGDTDERTMYFRVIDR